MTCHGRAGTCLFLLVFFGASFLAISSDIVFCGALFAISGAEILGYFVEFGFVGTAPMDSGREKFSDCSIFGCFGAPCFRTGFFRRYPEFRFFAFLSGILFYGTCLAKTAPEKFRGHAIFGFLSVWRPCGGCFAIFVG